MLSHDHIGRAPVDRPARPSVGGGSATPGRPPPERPDRQARRSGTKGGAPLGRRSPERISLRAWRGVGVSRPWSATALADCPMPFGGAPSPCERDSTDGRREDVARRPGGEWRREGGKADRPRDLGRPFRCRARGCSRPRARASGSGRKSLGTSMSLLSTVWGLALCRALFERHHQRSPGRTCPESCALRAQPPTQFALFFLSLSKCG